MATTPIPGGDTRDLEASSFRASFAPSTVNLEKRTVDLIWSTGARVLRGWYERWYEELSLDPKHVRMGRLNNGAPLLDSHRMYEGTKAVIGVVESARLEKGQGVATVRFAKAEDDPEADKVFRKIADGILQNISVGYSTYRLEQVVGGEGEIPVYRATDWEPFEISVVPAGADDGAGVRGAAAGAPTPCVVVTNATPKENRMSVPTPAPVPPSPIPDDATRAAEAATRAERERISTITTLVARHKLGDEFARSLVDGNVSLESARAQILDKIAAGSEKHKTEQHVRAEAGEDAREKFVRGACAAIFQRAMVAETIRTAQKSERFGEHFRDVALDPAEFRGMRLLDLARESLERRGVSTKGLHGEQLVKRAIEFRDAGMNTTSDFAILLETAMHKTLLGSYATTPDTWRRFCAVKSVSDFRTASFYRTGSFGKLDSLTEAGEFKHKQIPDGEKATLSASTKGNIVGLTRKAIVNDDLGAFNDLATGLGRAAALSIEEDVYALILLNSGLGPTQANSQPLFHSSRANVGTTGAMSVTTLDGSRAVMAAQKDPSGNEILDLRPAIWLGPVGLGGEARVLNDSQYEPVDNKFMKPNKVRGLFRDVVDTARLTGTRHYLFADPGVAPVFAVAFIDGQQAPELVSEQAFAFDGVQWRVKLDYGAGVLDYRGGVTCAGA